MNQRFFLLAAVLTAFLFTAFSFACDDDDDNDDNNDNATDDDLSPADDDSADDDASPADDDDLSDDDTTADDDNDDDSTTGEPAVLDVENTECKDGAGGAKEDDWPQSLEFSYESGILSVTHINGQFNCCIDYIEVTLTVQNNVIDLYEQEVAAAPCWCICPFDVTTRIANLAPGVYAVNAYANGTLAVSGETTIPAGE